jgi:hypothetical protein
LTDLETLLDNYINRLKEDPHYLQESNEWDWGLCDPWKLKEDDREVRIEYKEPYGPIGGAVGVGIVILSVFLIASLMAWFAYKHGNFMFVYLIYSIAFLTSIIMTAFIFGVKRNLAKKGRCWFVWNKRQDSVSLPRRNISFSCADILALQYREPGGEDNIYFDVVVFSRGNLQRIHILEFWGAPSEVRIIHDTARFLKKPLIRIPYLGKDSPVVWKEHCQENES